MALPKLPKTDVKLSTSSSFFILREDALSTNSILGFLNEIFTQPNLNNIITKMIPVFAVTSFIENQSRTTVDRWETDSDTPGQSLEIFQSPVSRRLTVKRMVLYASDFIQVAGFQNELTSKGIQDGSILAQQKPFIFIQSERAPEGSGIASTITMYRGCLFAKISRTYNVSAGTDLAVMEDADIHYAGRQEITV